MYHKAIRPGGKRPIKRDPDEDDDKDIIDLSRSSYSSKRQNAEAGPSRSKTPIVIDSDEDEEALRIERLYADEGTDDGPKEQKMEEADVSGGLDHFEAREAVRTALSKLDMEMKDVRAQIEPLQALLVSLQAEKRDLESQLTSLHTSSALTTKKTQSAPARTGSKPIDYQSSTFPWSSSLLITLKKTFDISSFRLCQEGVINAAIDGRDIVCVMPTGGGKSLTYQLPAVLGKRGLTVVISPLLALIWDQVRAMKEIGVESIMLTGSTSKEEQNDIYRRLEKGESNGEKEIRLCYLTPEKVCKSKRLMSVLEKANAAGRLRRFVIDEAHCCSQLGHDFRPDYKNLSVLKTLFPRVPIQAVTATLSTKTLPDLLKILRLAPICDGRQANPTGTVFFTAPLYRPNLHYKVLGKPSSAKAAVEAMGKWIQEHHAGQSGIIYCLSKKDAEVVADSLREWSKGGIKTGVYHAGIDDYEKERIHVNWRKGKVNCICATIAFGLGIDKGDVRYVIHHSMSKSLDGYYQETGRAGRDGKDSDCVLFYRGQDASRMASLTYSDTDSSSKLHEMTRFAQDLTTCRKVAFAKYFSTSANLSANAWDTAATLTNSSTAGSLITCGTCDNCTRNDDAIITKDVTLGSWRIIKVLKAVDYEGGRVTVGATADLVRGLGGGSFPVVEGRKRRKVSGKSTLDLDKVAGGRVALSKDDTERLIIHLILSGYIREYYTATAYAVNIYLQPSQDKSLRLSRLTQAQVEGGQGVKIECTFLSTAKKGKGTKKMGKKEVVDIGIEDMSDDPEAFVDDDEAEAVQSWAADEDEEGL